MTSNEQHNTIVTAESLLNVEPSPPVPDADRLAASVQQRLAQKRQVASGIVVSASVLVLAAIGLGLMSSSRTPGDPEAVAADPGSSIGIATPVAASDPPSLRRIDEQIASLEQQLRLHTLEVRAREGKPMSWQRELTTVAARNRAAGSLIVLGRCEQTAGDTAAAQAVGREVLRVFPDTLAAAAARELLSLN